MILRYSKITGMLFLFLCLGCASHKLNLKEWHKLPKEHYTVPPYAKHLANYKIALDPGHGGNAHLAGYKRGPTGKREAVMNLNVARFLKEFLEMAGAEVFLTRVDDSFISLQKRADLAAENNCDFMISLHHNKSRNPQTNFSAVFYHLTPDFSPFSMDLARNIYFGLVDELHLPQVIDDGLLTDKLIYPAGFGLLRRSKIPAILLESSFYSYPKEEKRLMDLDYNRREAYGIFLGLARWAAGGIPKAVMQRTKKKSCEKQPAITYKISDGITERGGRNLDEQLIFSHSITTRIDGHEVPFSLSSDKETLTFRPDTSLSNGIHILDVNLQNMFKNHNLPRTDTLIIASPVDSIKFNIATTDLPADTAAMLSFTLDFFDKDGQIVWDGTKVLLAATEGHVKPTEPQLKNGRALVYYQSSEIPGTAFIIAQGDSFKDSLSIQIEPKGETWLLSGTVSDDSTGAAIEEAVIFLNDSLRTRTDVNGFFFVLNPFVAPTDLRVTKNGYSSKALSLEIDSTRSQIRNLDLNAIEGGVLHDAVIMLDPSSQHPATKRANLDLATFLADTLKQAGAKVILIRADAKAIPVEKRIKKVNRLPTGRYIKLEYQLWEKDSLHVQITIYPANKTAEKIAAAILLRYSELPKTGGVLLQNTDVPEVTLTNKTALEVIITCREPLLIEKNVPNFYKALVDFYRMEKSEILTTFSNN